MAGSFCSFFIFRCFFFCFGVPFPPLVTDLLVRRSVHLVVWFCSCTYGHGSSGSWEVVKEEEVTVRFEGGASFGGRRGFLVLENGGCCNIGCLSLLLN